MDAAAAELLAQCRALAEELTLMVRYHQFDATSRGMIGWAEHVARYVPSIEMQMLDAEGIYSDPEFGPDYHFLHGLISEFRGAIERDRPELPALSC